MPISCHLPGDCKALLVATHVRSAIASTQWQMHKFWLEKKAEGQRIRSEFFFKVLCRNNAFLCKIFTCLKCIQLMGGSSTPESATASTGYIPSPFVKAKLRRHEETLTSVKICRKNASKSSRRRRAVCFLDSNCCDKSAASWTIGEASYKSLQSVTISCDVVSSSSTSQWWSSTSCSVVYSKHTAQLSLLSFMGKYKTTQWENLLQCC